MARSGIALLTSLLVTAGVGFALGWLSGFPLAGLSTGLLVFSMTMIVSTERIARWIESGFAGDAPATPRPLSGIIEAAQRADRKARAQERSLRQVLGRVRVAADAVPDALVALDESGRVLWSNGSAGPVLGVRDEDVGVPLSDLVRNPALVSFLEGDASRGRLSVASPVRDQIALSVRLVPYGVGQRLLIAQDVTRLQRLERTRRDFISNVSHELRTPLTVLNGYLESMSQSTEFSGGRWRTPISQMVAQATRMDNIVADLLHLSRLETGSAADRQESVAVPRMLSAIREDALALSGESHHEITLDCAPDLWISGDESELRSAFSNIVFNAVRYTAPAGHIDMRWRRDAGGAQFSVEDDGEGIAPEHVTRITERFYRVDIGRSRDAGGTGLGLAIVKHVMLQHGAKLEISSKPGVGSTFTCRFPPDRVVPPRAQQAIA